MRWDLWARKAVLGALTAGAIALVGVLVLSVDELARNPAAPAYVAVIAPVALHLLGLANNWLKHRAD